MLVNDIESGKFSYGRAAIFLPSEVKPESISRKNYQILYKILDERKEMTSDIFFNKQNA